LKALIFDPLWPRAMTEEEMVRMTRSCRYSPREPRMFKRSPGLRPIAREAGISHMTIYRAIDSGQLSAASAEALGPVLERVTFRNNQNPRPL
jgi:hypothetical protein